MACASTPAGPRTSSATTSSTSAISCRHRTCRAVRTASLSLSAATSKGTTGSALIQGNVIERYQKNGPTVDNAGSFAHISHNVIRGVGPTPTIAQNGIQVSRGAGAVVEHNWVADNTYLGAPATGGTGVLLFTPGSVRVAHTTSVRSDDNFGLYDTEAATIAYDKGEESTFFDGIFVDSGSTNNQITHGHFLDNAIFDCEDESVGAGPVVRRTTGHITTARPSNRPALESARTRAAPLLRRSRRKPAGPRTWAGPAAIPGPPSTTGPWPNRRSARSPPCRRCARSVGGRTEG